MTHGEQIDAFRSEVEAVIHRFRSEFNLPYASAIGVLTMVTGNLMAEARDMESDPDEDDE